MTQTLTYGRAGVIFTTQITLGMHERDACNPAKVICAEVPVRQNLRSAHEHPTMQKTREFVARLAAQRTAKPVRDLRLRVGRVV